jgi:hypothetical protein
MMDFINGLITALHLIAGLLFVKFWLKTHDRLFAMFALAFVMMAVSRIAFSALPYLMRPHSEHAVLVYGVRLLAYAIILAAILDRSRRSRRRTIPGGVM